MRTLAARPHLAVPALFALLLGIAALIALAGRRGSNQTPPSVLGHVEGCLACHGAVGGLGAGHDPRALGCSTCHLGVPASTDARRAHDGMVRVPGNLDDVDQTCGRPGCHDAIAARVRTSLMATARGLLAVDRFIFGEQPTPDGTATPRELGVSPAETHLKQLCVSCHLGARKAEPAPPGERSRGGGCVACHLVGAPPGPSVKQDPARFVHSGLSLRVGDEHCFGCHSRSGRISLNYIGLAELSDAEAARRPAAIARRLEDGRPTTRTTDDVHHARGMACIDCHTAAETMGDGAVHLHEEEATRVRCTTCHRVEPARRVTRDALDPETAAIVKLRDGDAAAPDYLVEDRSGVALSNARVLEGDRIEVRGKLDGRVHVAGPPAPACRAIAGHARLACQSCHSAWVPRCVGCHTQHDATTNEWVEYDVPPSAGRPALGVLSRDGHETIEPFTPGMILTINPPRPNDTRPLPRSAADLLDDKTRFVRAYALAVPHTTTRASSECRDCHDDPAALGYGEGTLSVDEKSNNWQFKPAYQPSRFDGLPGDAWIPFLREPTGAITTRRHARPLDLAEQRRVLTVGACLGCHAPAKKPDLYNRFNESKARMRPSCRVPAE